MAEINSIDRLQFRHHSEAVTGTSYENPIPQDENGVITGETIEEARANAVAYISGTTDGQLVKYSMWAQAEEGCDNPLGHSLYGEPTVVKYGVPESNSIVPSDQVHLLLAIGMETNNSDYADKNMFCIIDIDKTEQEIADLWEELEKAIKALTLHVLDTDTIDLELSSGDTGVTLSGDVKTARYHIWDDITRYNSIMVGSGDTAGPQGLFVYVNLEYDKEHETFKFTRSLYDGTLQSTEVELPNNYVTGGVYDFKTEDIVLNMKNGDEVRINCEHLIYEWDVAPSGSTPIVLKRERVKYAPLPHHKHSDILSADIMIDESRPYNILKRNTINSAVYVDGHAKNIAYDWNGESMTVNDALNDLKNIRISPDRSNILQDRADGFFANTTLDFISSENQLVFRTTNVDGTIKEKILQLNTVEVPIDDIYYDARTETLIIKWRNDKGEIQTLKIPIGDMIDEWEVLNPGHNVHLNKVRSVGGNDKLSADVNIYNGENNILVDRDHSLYVKGTADNIKYKDTTVEAALDNLDQKIDDEEARAKAAEQALDEKIDAETERAQDAEAELQNEIEAVSGIAIAKLSDIENIDESISIDKTNPIIPKIKVDISEGTENSIRLNRDGLYVYIDLDYDSSGNTLTLKKTDKNKPDELVEKTIQLDSISFIDEIYYDPATDDLVIIYWSGRERKEMRVPMKGLIEEWTTSENTDGAIKLTKFVNSGVTPDVLYGEVLISDIHGNILENENGKLYVPVDTDATRALSGAIIQEISARTDGDRTLEDAIQNEATDRQLADASLSAFTITAVNEEKTRAMTAEGALQNAIVAEKERAEAADAILRADIDREVARSTEKDSIHDAKIAALEASATTLDRAIEAERTRAMSAETELSTRITNVNDSLANEITRSTNKDVEHDTSIISLSLSAHSLSDRILQEAADRDIADAALRELINTEKSDRIAQDTVITERLANEINRSTAEDDRLNAALQQEINDRTSGDAELEQAIRDATLTFKNTVTAKMNKSDANEVTTDVIVPRDNNIIIVDEGIKAYVRLDYNEGTNTLILEKTSVSGTSYDTVQLNAGSIIQGITYDSHTRELVITYEKTSQPGVQYETRVNVEDLFNPWLPNNPAEKSAVELTLVYGTGPLGEDQLSARALITDDTDGDGVPDAPGTDNAIRIRNNGLYVSGADMEDAKKIAECVKNEVKVFETAVIGHIIGEECGSGYTYEPNRLTTYINSAASFNEADIILDNSIKNVEIKVDEVSAKTDCIDGEAEALYHVLYGSGHTMPECGEGLVYVPDPLSCVISGATSFMEADRFMAYQICEILEMWVSGMTCTSVSNWVDDGANKKMLVDVRASAGNEIRMTDDDLYITNLTGKTIESGVTEFNDTNVLRIVCLNEGPVIPDVSTPQNGLYLSNIWDCGKYYQASTEADEMAQVEADGYNVNYLTDESDDAKTADYSNYLRC